MIRKSKKNTRLKTNVEILLTETQRRICERLLDGPATYKQIFSYLYESHGPAHQDPSCLNAHIFYLKKNLQKIGVELGKRPQPGANSACRELFFSPQAKEIIADPA